MSKPVKLDILDIDYQRDLLQQFAELENWYLITCNMNDPYIKQAYGITASLRITLQQWIDLHEFSEVRV